MFEVNVHFFRMADDAYNYIRELRRRDDDEEEARMEREDEDEDEPFNEQPNNENELNEMDEEMQRIMAGMDLDEIELNRVLLNDAARQQRDRLRMEAGEAEPEREEVAEARHEVGMVGRAMGWGEDGRMNGFGRVRGAVRRLAREEVVEARHEVGMVGRAMELGEDGRWNGFGRARGGLAQARRLAREEGEEPLQPLFVPARNDARVQYEGIQPRAFRVELRDIVEDGFFLDHLIAGEGWDEMPRRRGGITEEMIKEAQTLREKDASTPCPTKFARECLVCSTENPYQRAVFIRCGHIVCFSCAVDNARSDATNGKCVYCRKKSDFVKLFEEESIVVEKKTTDVKVDNKSKTEDDDNDW